MIVVEFEWPVAACEPTPVGVFLCYWGCYLWVLYMGLFVSVIYWVVCEWYKYMGVICEWYICGVICECYIWVLYVGVIYECYI